VPVPAEVVPRRFLAIAIVVARDAEAEQPVEERHHQADARDDDPGSRHGATPAVDRDREDPADDQHRGQPVARKRDPGWAPHWALPWRLLGGAAGESGAWQRARSL